jgi:acyl transferase domain-containing protein/thioesterase domain-containing protein
MYHYSDPSHSGDDDAGETAVAIVGMACRFAQSRGLDAYWTLLKDGREAISTYDEDALVAAGVNPALLRNPNYVRSGAPIEDMECFDAGLFGLSPRDAAIMDPQHRHFLECTWEALENAGHTPQRFEGVVGVFAGSGHNAYMPYNLLTNAKLVRDVGLFLLRHTSNDKDFLTTRVSYLFDLKGPSINIQTACSTSLVAIHMAAQSLLNGECDMALAGGASIELPHRQGYLYEEGEILSPDGHCRPFDVQSQGTVFGSGAGVVVLRRLADAIADGDHIYAVLRGSAINNDGAGKVGYLAPSVDGQAKVIAEALAIAGVEADSIGYVEAHGTGTPVGDPIEVAALTAAFRQSTDRIGFCRLGSAKGNIGHTDTAAGAAGLIKVALALHHGELPPSLNFDAPNPACALEQSPFVIQASRSQWATALGQPRRAGISSLGVGGTNAHVVLEEAPLRLQSGPSRRRQLLLCSAKSATALSANASALGQHLVVNADMSLADAAFTLTTGRQHLPQRRFVVADDTTSAAAALLADDAKAAPGACITDRPVAFLFCGAGPQHVDMARGLYETEPGFRADVDQSLQILNSLGVADVRRWLFPTDADRAQAVLEMERPSIALPALFTIQTALARHWMSIGVRPSAMIGHSSGEYAAAHLAGVIDLQAGLRIVSGRGRLFETIKDGGMLSVPMSEAELSPLLPPELTIAAINAPRLCVVSGPGEAVARFHRQLEEQEIEAQILKISVAAHSPMLDPILPQFRALMEKVELRAPDIPFASNLTGDWVSARDVTDPEYWVRHLRQTVRFTDGLQRLLVDPDRVLLEVGPGRSMSSLARQHPDRQRAQPVLNSLRHPDQAVEDDAYWLDVLGQLWTLGVEIDWDAYWGEERRLRVPLPTYQFDRQRHWIEPGAAHAVSDVDPDGPVERAPVSDWQFEPIWTRSTMPVATTREGAALILADETGLADRIADQLRAEGRSVVMVLPGNRFQRQGHDRFTVDPASMADYAHLFDCLSADGTLPAQIYHCWLVTGDRIGRRDAGRLIDRGFHSLTAMVPELARQLGEKPVEVAIVTDRVHRVTNEADLVPQKATALGAASVIGTEYPNLHVRCIDVQVPAAIHRTALDAPARDLIGEVSVPCEAGAICHRNGERWVLEHRAITEESGRAAGAFPNLRPGATYVITGGLGGLGLALARHLAQWEGVRIALLTRKGLPPREQWAELLANGAVEQETADRIRKLLALEAGGATIEIVVCDVADARAMQRAMKQVASKLGPITGVFHAAGTLDDGLMETKSRAAMDAVLRPKVDGTLALDAALRGHRVDFIMLFSSISAFAGIAGQADYAAANAFLDCYAQSRRGDPVTQVISVAWSQWREVGMAAGLQRQAEAVAGPAEKLGEGKPVDHPFFDRLHSISVDDYVVSGILTPETHWVLDEHRVVGGDALMPGTGYLELARAAHALVDHGPAVLSDVTFLTPFSVPDGTARELRVSLRRRVGNDWRFVVLGRPVGASQMEWTQHAEGAVSARATAEVPEMLDIAGIRERCDTIVQGPCDTGPTMQFGPRWDTIQQVALNSEEALLNLAMDPAFHGECGTLQLHPALLDFATAGAQMLIPDYDPRRDFFAPFSYRRVILHAPLPPVVVSHVRYRPRAGASGSTAVFDVTIVDPFGQVLAEISEFTMMRVRDASVLSRSGGKSLALAQADASASAEVSAIPDGILPEEGLQVIDQILAGRSRAHVVISPYDLRAHLAKLRAPRKAPRRVVPSDREGNDDQLPATATEQVIAALWSDLLGVDPIYRNDNFFDLGGHSLLAVQFTNRLRKKTGKILPLAAMMDTPTVANLAREIDPDSAIAVAEGEQGAVSSSPARDIVTIRGGGTQTPIFFVHDGLGETLLYRGLALRLDLARPIYGVEPLRTPSGNFAHTSIHEMAANYVERIQTVQSKGPYLLSGLCAGGVIAFEMARQLQDQGQRVAFVGIIDAADVTLAKRPFYITRTRLRRIKSLVGQGDLLHLLPALVKKSFNAVRWEIASRLQEAHNRRVVQRIGHANANADAIDHAEAGHHDPAAISFLKLYEVAHQAHRPEGVFEGGVVALFKASEGNGQVEDIPYAQVYNDFALGWGRRVSDDVTVVSVPGGHSTVLQEPHVGTLAWVFQEAVDCATSSIDMQTAPEPKAVFTAPMEVAAE